MENDIALLNDIWSLFKNHVDQHQRVDVATDLLEVFDDHGMDLADIHSHIGEFDRVLKMAAAEYYCDEFHDLDDQDSTT